MESSPNHPADIFGHAFQVQLKERLLRDPLHGLIAVDENSRHGRLLVNLIDSREFQRLRRIRQLGLAHYAFHGAEHSRFTHSMGAFHLMRSITDQLSRMYAIDGELAFYAHVAALLHDIGHGPYSHVCERFFKIRHETWTVRMLHDECTEVHQILTGYSRNLPSIIESMLIGRAKPGYLCSLVNGQLDADRLDYLLRDSLMTGVKYGIFDLDRLIHMLRISPEGDRIIIGEGGIGPIEKYIQARYHMYKQVYLHKTVTAAEAMLVVLLRRATRLMEEGKDAGVPAGSPLSRVLNPRQEIAPADYLELDDADLNAQIKVWARSQDSILADVAGRMLGRRLFKTLDFQSDTDVKKRIEEAVEFLRSKGIDPEYYLLLIEASDTSYAPYDPTGSMGANTILIEDGRGGIVDVANISPMIQAFTKSGYEVKRMIFPQEGHGVQLRGPLTEIFSR